MAHSLRVQPVKAGDRSLKQLVIFPCVRRQRARNDDSQLGPTFYSIQGPHPGNGTGHLLVRSSTSFNLTEAIPYECGGVPGIANPVKLTIDTNYPGNQTTSRSQHFIRGKFKSLRPIIYIESIHISSQLFPTVHYCTACHSVETLSESTGHLALNLQKS